MKRLRRLILASTCWLTLASTASAQEPATALAAPQGLMVVDWLIIVLYAMSTLWLGWFIGRKQQSTREYFIGSGHIHPVLIGVSMFATLLSTISYLSMPGEALGKGPGFMTSMLAYPVLFFIVGWWILPVYMNQRVTSAYELLEAKLGGGVRLLGASMFIVLRLVWMALLVFLTAKAMSIMMGLDPKWVPAIALAAGLVAVIYTSIGGLQAVVITDCMQTVLLFGGALLVIGVITFDLGGFGWFPTQWDPNWDTQPLLPLVADDDATLIEPEADAESTDAASTDAASTVPQAGEEETNEAEPQAESVLEPVLSFVRRMGVDIGIRVTIFGSILNFLIWYVCTTGGDQTSVQRFMATTDLKAARRAYAVQLLVATFVGVTLGIVGFAMLGYFSAHPELIPAGMDLKDDADKFFPHFIAYHLPVGISGLVVSAMFAAAMSSIDSGVNSITAVVMTDFVDRFRLEPLSEKQHMRLARYLAFGIGAFVVATSSLMEHVPGNITSVTQKTSNLLTTPIFGLFFFALFVPFAKPVGVVAGAVCGTITAALIAFSGPIFGMDPTTGLDPISFQWISPAAVLVNIVVGCVVSLATGGGSSARSENQTAV